MQTILNKFLAAGLLPIGEDDEKLTLLEQASQSLSSKIKKTPLLTYRLAMVGLDAKVPGEDPAYGLVSESVLEQWQTIVNRVGAKSVQVYRAVILRAIEIAAEENSNVAPAVLLVAENQHSPHYGTGEKDVVLSLLNSFNEARAQETNEIWIKAVDFAVLKLSKTKRNQLNKDDLSLALSRAVGPKDKDNRPLNAPNPHWPNAGEPWANEFVGRATDAISSAIQNSAKLHAEELQEALREIIAEIATDIEKMSIRDAKSELLWIRASMYSPSAKCGYKDLDNNRLILHAALDVSRSVNQVAPTSVEYFLRSLVNVLPLNKTRLTSLLDWVRTEFIEGPEIELIKADPLPVLGRRSLLDFAIRPSTKGTFEEQTGFPEKYEEATSELAVKFYREIQIRKLLSSANER